ncbi:hypothetical protein LCGC14_0238660 [marine sediment metagenome]|uniref:YHS domain-containing protein n=1 Tax=marine sediment metagenome TaxID=412755 RepID=A0A0F9U819_9ZZZZ|nr:hypothetical protein [Phycisphaerae bacterium]HDZ42681.1 hypothetical protein [Phycisphaerae bacterium]
MFTKRNHVMLLALFVVGAFGVGLLVGCGDKGAKSTEAKAPATEVVINSACPMMGTAMDPAKVSADLTREFKGKKIGFCCAKCPVAWDKLSDEEKDAKLAETES